MWDGDKVIETLAGCSNMLVARAAYGQAIVERSRYHVTLRNRTRLVREHKGS